MEMYIPRFLDSAVTGESLLNLDSALLKQLGVLSKNDREKLKEKIKELKKQNDREKKELEKERKKKEKLIKSGSKNIKRWKVWSKLFNPVKQMALPYRTLQY